MFGTLPYHHQSSILWHKYSVFLSGYLQNHPHPRTPKNQENEGSISFALWQVPVFRCFDLESKWDEHGWNIDVPHWWRKKMTTLGTLRRFFVDAISKPWVRKPRNFRLPFFSLGKVCRNGQPDLRILRVTVSVFQIEFTLWWYAMIYSGMLKHKVALVGRRRNTLIRYRFLSTI